MSTLYLYFMLSIIFSVDSTFCPLQSLNLTNRNPMHEQLPLPDSYQKHKTINKIFSCIHINITLMNCSFLVEEVSSVEILYQSVFISLTVLLLFFSLSYKRHVDMTTSKNVFAIMAIIVGTIVVAKVPYYSIVVIILTLILVIKTLKKQKIIKTSNFILSKYDEIIFNFNMVYLSLILLVHEGMLRIDNRYVLVPFWICTLFMGGSMNSYFIAEFRKDRIFKRSVYYSDFNQKLGFAIINTHIFSFIAFLLHAYLDYTIVTPVLIISLMLNIVVSIVLVYFAQESILLVLAPKYSKEQTVFRTQARTYEQIYSEPKCLKDFIHNDNDCLLCHEKAVNINFPCGHLTTCSTCQLKLRQKYYVSCLVCKKMVSKKRVLRQQQQSIRRGYMRKIFIEKKLLKNQFLCQL